MHGTGFFYQAFVYLTAAVVSVPIAKRLGLGSVLGYLIAGIAIGPFGLSLIGEEGHDVMHFAEFGVVMMLFLVGLELEPSRLWRLRGPVLGMGGIQVGATTLVVGAIAVAAGLPWQSALAVGLILALSSTATALQHLREEGLMETDAGQRSFAVLLFQDMAVIPMLALLPLLATGTGPAGVVVADPTWVDRLPGWGHALAVLGAVVGIVAVGRFLAGPILRFIASTRLRELFTAAALLMVIAIALLMTKVGLSPALGTFLAGVVLATSEYRHELEGDIEPFKGILLGLFFIAVGASVDFGLVAEKPFLIGGLVLGLIVVKLLLLVVLGRTFGMGFDQNLLFSLILAQGGEFAFVLFSFATRNHVLPAHLTGPLVAVVALSMALTPLLLVVHERFIQPRIGTREAVDREAADYDDDAVVDERAVIIAGFGRFGSIVGRFLRANGVACTVLDHDSDRVDLLRKLGLNVFYGDASRLDLLRAAGAAEARVLVLALDDPERTLELARAVRTQFPDLTLLVRVHGRPDAYELLDAGATQVYRETLDTSLRMGVEVLRRLGHGSHQAHRALRTFRKHEERSVRELAGLRHDQSAYLTEARRWILDLEATLQAEQEKLSDFEDAAWDSASRRREFGTGPRGDKAES